MHITIDQGYQSPINIDPLIENFDSKAVADSDKSLEKLKWNKSIDRLSYMMLESDHLHYCKECKHWLCKRTEFKCKFISNSMTSHRKHIDSMDIDNDGIKHIWIFQLHTW